MKPNGCANLRGGTTTGILLAAFPRRVSEFTMREKSLKLSLIDAFLSALVIGLGETYLPAYVLSIGMGEIFAGYIVSLPIVSGALLQLITPKGLQRVQSHKTWVVSFTFLQALCFVPLIYFSATRAPDFWTLFLILTLYWGSGFSAGLAWNYWMGRLVNLEEGTKFFSKRARIAQGGILTGLLLGGIALQLNLSLGPFTSVFSILFIGAGVARLCSSYIISNQYFAPEWVSQTSLGLRASWKTFWNNTEKRKFFFYLAPFQAAVFVSSPFVTPFMLAQLQMNYQQYMTAIALLFVGKTICMYLIEKHRRDISGTSMFVLGALLIIPFPMCWAFTTSVWASYLIQLGSGFAWAFVEVGLALIFFKDIKNEEKVPILTVYNLLNSVAIICGTLLGGKLLWLMGESLKSYQQLFVIAALFRLSALLPLAWFMKDKWIAKPKNLTGSISKAS